MTDCFKKVSTRFHRGVKTCGRDALPIGNVIREAEMVGFAVLSSPGLGWETDETSGRRPVLLQSWSIDPTTGKPVARWVAEPQAPLVAAAPLTNHGASSSRKTGAELVIA
jgi:hypothetical protein